jgi:hypothetical protein
VPVRKLAKIFLSSYLHNYNIDANQLEDELIVIIIKTLSFQRNYNCSIEIFLLINKSRPRCRAPFFYNMILETENFATMNGFDIVERVECRLSCYKFGMLNLATTISQKLRLSIRVIGFFPNTLSVS